MNAKKLIVLFVLGAPGMAHSNPATLSVLVSSTAAPAQVLNSTITVNVGTGAALGAADFTLSFDTHVVSSNALTPIAAELQGNVFFNPAALANGQVRVIALNGGSAGSPSGLVSLAGMTLSAGNVN